MDAIVIIIIVVILRGRQEFKNPATQGQGTMLVPPQVEAVFGGKDHIP